MTPEEALGKCIELGERRQGALDELQQIRYELPRLCEFAIRSRGVSVTTVAEAVGVRRETIHSWLNSKDSVGWMVWGEYGNGDTPRLE